MGLVGSSPTLSSKIKSKMKKKEVLTGTFESSKRFLRQEPKEVKLKFRLIRKLIKRLHK